MLRSLLRAAIGFSLALIGIWAGTGLYFHLTDQGPWPERTAINPSGVFASETNCYVGGGYDEWMGGLRQRNGSWNPRGWLISIAFPRSMYEQAANKVDCRFIRYESDGYEIPGFVLAPRETNGQRLPILVFNRGGNAGYGAITFALALQFLAPYAEDGFLVVASQYRGLDTSDPEHSGADEFGGSEVRDVEKLIALARRHPKADPNNVFVLGSSRGGMMSFLVARGDPHLRALATINGESDLELGLQFRPEMERVYAARIPDYAADKHVALAQRSVLRWADELPRDLPVLLIHGGRDDRVDPQSGPRLKARLNQVGIVNKLVVYPDDDHLLRKHRDEARTEVVAWFRAHMQVSADDQAGSAVDPH